MGENKCCPNNSDASLSCSVGVAFAWSGKFQNSKFGGKNMSVKIAPLYVLRTPDLLLLITGNGDDDDSTNMTRIIANCEDTITQ